MAGNYSFPVRETEQQEVQEALGEKYTSLYVGNISVGLNDFILESIFKCCGEILKWKRVVDQDGRPKPFGFVEFRTADGVGRAMRLLDNYPLFGKNLIVRASQDTKDHVARYETEVSNYLGQQVSLAEFDPQVMTEIHNAIIAAEEALKRQQGIKELLDFSHVFEKRPMAKKKSLYEEEEEEQERRREEKRKREQEAAFSERERRWENRELQNERSRRKEMETDKGREEGLERERILKMYAEFDDDSSSDRVCEFYSDREKWRARRTRELARETENDERDRQREMQEAKEEEGRRRKKEELHLSLLESNEEEEEESQPPIPEQFRTEEDRRREEEAEQKRKERYKLEGSAKVIGFGVSAKGNSGGRSDERGEKRRSAMEFSVNDDDDGEEEERLKTGVKKRKPLLPLQFTKEELLAEGYTPEQIEEKLKADEQLRVQRLIESIPTGRNELFGYKVEWGALDHELLETKIRTWVAKKVHEYLGVEEKSLINFVVDRLSKRTRPSDLAQELQAALENDAETFVMKVWRSLIFETEYKLVLQKK